MVTRISLDKEAAKICELTDPHPHVNELTPVEGRANLETIQSSEIKKFDADIYDELFETNGFGSLNVRFVRPKNVSQTLPVIFYIHGGGYVLGSAHTHDKLIRELAARTNSIIVFPEYSLSPEAKYPVAMEQCFAALQHLNSWSDKYNLDTSKVTVAGDSAGGNMAAVMALLCKQRGGQKVGGQLLFYPTLEGNLETDSFKEFKDHYYLTKDATEWFWEQYLPNFKEASGITIFPLDATLDELQGLPSTLIVNGQADVLRDDGVLYAQKLRLANVPVSQVTIQATIHDFVMLNALDQSNATRTAMDLATEWIKTVNS